MKDLKFKADLELIEAEIYNSEVIELKDIPTIDLYMDQVTTLMETGLREYKRTALDKALTKTMINNYAKAKIFPPPEKKKYTKYHIMLLIMIYHLKAVLSISDINRLLGPVTSRKSASEYVPRLEKLYNAFARIQKNAGDIEAARQTAGELDDPDIERIIMVFYYVLSAGAQKRMAEKLLDKYF